MYNITEAAAMVAGDPHSLWPPTLAPSIAAFANRAGDLAEDRQRQQLLPLIPLILDTNRPHIEQQAASQLCRTALRSWTPRALRAADWHQMAAKLDKAADLEETANCSAELLEQLMHMQRPHGRKKIGVAENLLTIASFYASSFNSMEEQEYNHDPYYTTDRTKTHRTLGAMAADILGITAETTKTLEPPQRVELIPITVLTIQEIIQGVRHHTV